MLATLLQELTSGIYSFMPRISVFVIVIKKGKGTTILDERWAQLMICINGLVYCVHECPSCTASLSLEKFQLTLFVDRGPISHTISQS